MATRTRRNVYDADGETLVASITSYEGSIRDAGFGTRMTREWQTMAWAYWGRLGELMDPTTQQANLVTRLQWNVTIDGRRLERNDGTDKLDEVEVFLSRVTEGMGRAEALKMLALNVQVAGECWYVWRGEPTGDIERDEQRGWNCYAITEPKLRDIENAPSNWHKLRVKVDDPRDQQYAISRFSTVIDPAEELLAMRALSRSQTKSRLAQAGILFRPSEAQFPKKEFGENEEDIFGDMLEEVTTAAILDEASPMAHVPIDVQVKAELIEKFRHLVFQRPYDDRIHQKIEAAIQSIAIALDIPADLLKGISTVNHWPCDEQTEVYTAEGWVTHDQLTEGTQVLSLDIGTGKSQFEPIDGVRREHVTDHPMVEITGQSHSSLTTYDHRWPVIRNGRREWAKTSDFLFNELPGNRRSIMLGAEYSDLPTERKLTNETVKLIAWAATDADVKHGNRLRIRQGKSENVLRIRDLLRGIEHNETGHQGLFEWVLSRNATAELNEYGDFVGTRWIPYLKTVRMLTAGQLELLLSEAERGNGGTAPGRTIFAADSRRLEPFEHAASLLGYRTTLIQRNTKSGWNKQPMWRVSWGPRTTFIPKAKSIEERLYTGVIFCPKVPVGRSFLARRNGFTFFTGNTAWLLEESNYQAHVQPLAAFIGDVLAVAGQKMGLGDVIEVTPDASELLARRSTVQDAFRSVELGAVGLKYLRAVIGANEDDIPTDDEVALQVLLRRGFVVRGTDISDAIKGTPVKEGSKPIGVEQPTPTVPETPGEQPRGPRRKKGGSTPGPRGKGGRPRGMNIDAIVSAVANNEEEPPVDFDAMTEELVAIDRALLYQLVGAMDMAIDTARNRIGAKLRSAVRSSDLHAEIADVSNSNVVSKLGVGIADESIGDMTETVHDSLLSLAAWWTRRAQEAVEAVSRVAFIDTSTPVWRENIRRSQVDLVDMMTAKIIAHIGRPDEDLPASPVDVARNTIAVLGGSWTDTRLLEVT